MKMVTGDSGGTPHLKRRALLTTIGASAIAGCDSYKQAESTQKPQSVDSQADGDCITQAQYEELKDEYEELREKYRALQGEINYALQPPYVVAEERKVSVTYETVDGDIDSWQWDSSTLTAQHSTGTMARELTYSQLEYLNLDIFGFEGNSKYTRLGDFGLYYQLNPFVIASNFTPLAEEFHTRYQSVQERIHEAWNFVTQLNDYVADIGETPRFPLETLLMGGGDCEDSAILLGSILYSMPDDLNPKFWYIDADNPTSPQKINHVIVSAETNDEAYLIETTSTQEMLPYDSVEGFSVEIEPTNTV